ncbi:MAG: hypothetical protein KGR26_13545, partial [Cyanobacteria bacterium REEB65]|nr:hypothetical protein [Cyanobacteria bacterium REEB65]
ATGQTELHGGEAVAVEVVERSHPCAADVVPRASESTMPLFLNGERIDVPIRGYAILQGDTEISSDSLIPDGAVLEVESAAAPIVADILPLIQSELIAGSEVGKSLDLQVDGQPAEFTTILREGSRIEARWVEISNLSS